MELDVFTHLEAVLDEEPEEAVDPAPDRPQRIMRVVVKSVDFTVCEPVCWEVASNDGGDRKRNDGTAQEQG